MKNGFVFSFLVILALGFISESPGDEIPLPPPLLTAEPMNFESELEAGENANFLTRITNIGGIPINWNGEVNLSPVNNGERLNRNNRPIGDYRPGPARDESGEVLERHQVPYRYVCGMVWDGELMWGTSYRQDRLFGINPENDEIPFDFRTCDNPRGLAFDGDNLYVNRGDEDRSRIFIYSLNGELIDYFDLPYRIQGMTIDGNERLLVNDFENQVIHVLNLEDRNELFVFSALNSLHLDNHSVGDLQWVEQHRPGQLWLALRDNSSNECYSLQVSIDENWNLEEIQRFALEEPSFYAISHDGQNLWHSGRYEHQSWWVYDDGIIEAQLGTIEPESGLLEINEEVEINIDINTENLFEGVYSGFLEISSENPDVPSLLIGLNISITGSPELNVNWDIGQDDNVLNWNQYFERIHVNETYSVPLIIRNSGTAQLEIDNIQFNSEFFVPSLREFSLPPRSWQLVHLDFITRESGDYDGILTITSSDPNQGNIVVNVIATAQTPPQAVIDPVEIIDVLPIGVVSELALNISNEGEDVLNWKVEFEGVELLQRDRLNNGNIGPSRQVRRISQELKSEDESPDQPQRDSAGQILQVHNVPYRDTRGLAYDGEFMWGVAWNENRLYGIDPDTDELQNNIEIHEMPRAFTWDGNNFYIGDVNRRIIYVYSRDGDMLDNFDLGFEYDGLTSNQHNYLYLNCRTDNKIHVFDIERRIEIGLIEYDDLIGNDDIDCLEWVPNHYDGKLWCLSRNHVYQLDVHENWEVDLVGDFNWNADQKYAGLAHDGENLWHGMRSEMRWYEHDDGINEVNWAEAQPDSGSLMGFMDEDLFITLNSNSVIGGFLSATMHVISNDPENGDILIPVSLQVIGIPDVSLNWEIGVDDNTINWSDYPFDVFANGSYSVPVGFSNSGTDLLIVEEIFSNIRVFQSNPNQLSVLPGDTVIVDFLFNPEEVGVIDGEMIIHTNVPGVEEFSIDLAAEALPPPVIQIEQRRIEDELQIREGSDQVVVISNTGESTLDWNTSLEFPDIEFRGHPQVAGNRNGSDLGSQYYLTNKDNTPFRDDPGDLLQQIEIPFDQTSGLAWDGNLMWGIDNAENHLFAVDINTGMLISDFEIHAQPRGLAFDGADFLVGGGREIYKYDRTGQLLARYRSIVRPDGIACDRRRFVFIKNGPDSNIHVLGIDDLEVVTTIDCNDVMEDFTFQSIDWVDLHFEGQLWCVTNNRVKQLYIDQNWHPEIINDFESIVDQEYSGIAHNGTNIVHGIRNQRFWIACDDGTDEIPWVTVVNPAGQIEPGGETEINLSFSAERYMGGDYSALLHINSNAPENPDEIVELQLTVVGNPEILTNPIAEPFENNVDIQFADTFINEGQSFQKIVIQNTGTDVLELLNIETDNDEFLPVAPEDLLILIRDSIEVGIEFSPVQAGLRQGRISIVTNAGNIEDGRVWFDLVGNGVSHPTVTTSPDQNDSISVYIQMFENEFQRGMTIRNDGDENSVDLEYSILSLAIDNNNRDSNSDSIPHRAIRSLRERRIKPGRDIPGEIIDEIGIPYLGTRDLVWDGELLWGIVTESDRMIAINPDNERIIHNFNAPDNANCMTFDGTYFYMGIEPDNSVAVCDRNGNIINTFEMPFEDIHGITIDDSGDLLVAAGRESVIHVFNISDFEEIADFQLGDLVNADLGSIEWVPEHPDGQLWIVSRSSIYQIFIDRNLNPELIGEIRSQFDLQESGLAHDGNNLWLGLNNIESWKAVDDGIAEIEIERWLSAIPPRGTIEPGFEIEISLVFSASNLEPSTDYQCELLVRTNDPDQPTVTIPVIMTTETLPEHFDEVQETYAFHNIRISEMTFDDDQVSDGYEIGIFTPDNILAGAVTWSSEREEPLNIRAYKNDIGTEITEGFEPGEEFSFIIWDIENECEWEFVDIVYEDGENFWEWRGNSMIAIHGSSMKTLQIELNVGWSLISINVIPPLDFWLLGDDGEPLFDGPDAILMTEQLRYVDENNVEQHHISILKDSNGLFYMPDWDFNNIPYWDLESGFQICVDAVVMAAWTGDVIPPDTPISMHNGWNMIAYYPEFELDASAPDYYVLSPIIDNVRIAKDEDGLFLMPAENFSNMLPWREKDGYLVQIESEEPVILRYPPEQEMIALNPAYNYAEDLNEGCPAKDVPHRSGCNMSVLVKSVSTQSIQAYDQVLAYNVSGNLLVGKGRISANGRCGLAVWGDDPATNAIDGLMENEKIILRLQKENEPGLIEDTKITFVNSAYETQNMHREILTYSTDGYAVIEIEPGFSVPGEFYLSQNYPNPFNSNTSVRYGLPQSSNMRLDIFDVSGRLVDNLLNEEQPAGHHSFIWDGKGRSSGVYILRMKSGSFRSVKKITLIK